MLSFYARIRKRYPSHMYPSHPITLSSLSRFELFISAIFMTELIIEQSFQDARIQAHFA